MEEKKKKKTYVMSTEVAMKKIKEGIFLINTLYGEIKDAEKTINNADININDVFNEIFKIYKANRNRLPDKFRFISGRYHVHLGKGKTTSKKGILESLKDSLVRRILIITLRGRSKGKIEKIQSDIKNVFKKQKVTSYKMKVVLELNKERIKRHPRIIEGVEGVSIVRKKFFMVKPIELKKVPDELKKEFS